MKYMSLRYLKASCLFDMFYEVSIKDLRSFKLTSTLDLIFGLKSFLVPELVAVGEVGNEKCFLFEPSKSLVLYI